MSTNRQALLHDFPTPVALLRREAGRNDYHLMTSSRSLIDQDVDKRSPGCISNALCQRVILEHAIDVQVFHTDTSIALCVGLGGLKVKVTALPLDFEMGLGAIACCLAPAAAPLLASAELPLFAPQGPLAFAVIARIGNRSAVGVGQKYLEAHIQPNIRVLTGTSCLLVAFLFRWLTDNERIPVAIGAQDQMSRLGCALSWPVQLDLQEQAQLRRNVQVLPVSVEPDIAALGILAKLNTMPAIGRLEAWEATGEAMLLECEIPPQRLIQSISQRLHRRGWHMLATTPLKSGHQVILEEELTGLGIVGFRGFQHLVVQATRVLQAGHQLLALLGGWIQAILKRSHVLIIIYRANSVNRRQGRVSSPCLKAWTLTRTFLVN